MRKKMKKLNQTGTGNDRDLSIKKQMGLRFKKFRDSLDKTQTELAEQLEVYQSTITNIEVGKTFPGLKYLNFLGEFYGLNADWIVNGRGEMIGNYFPFPLELVKKYSALLNLMQIPVVAQLMLARLEEVKVIAREEINRFQDP
jgi:DNA-binding XRE family transcriptional regulator